MHQMATPAAIDVAAAWHEVGDRLRAFASKRLPPHEADDVVQSVMVKLLERHAEVGRDSVRAWLFAVTRNAVAEHYRRRRETVDLGGFDDIAAAAGSDAADRARGSLADCVEPMLRLLDPADADILRRVDLNGEPQTDIARATGLSPSTVKSRVQRARAKLRAKFECCCRIELSQAGAPIGVEPGDTCGRETAGTKKRSRTRSC